MLRQYILMASQLRFMIAAFSDGCRFIRLLNDNKAITAIEYAVISAIMAMLIVTGVSLFDGDAALTYGKISDTLDTTMSSISSPPTSGPTNPAANLPANPPGSQAFPRLPTGASSVISCSSAAGLCPGHHGHAKIMIRSTLSN